MALSPKIKSIIIEIICMLYVLLFVYAAASKLMGFENFQVQLGQSPLLSAFASWLSWIVPLAELLISALLIFRTTRLWALAAAFNIMVMFTVYIFVILNYSSYVPCSCGGILEKMSWNDHMLFNLVFVVLAFTGIIMHCQIDRDVNNKKWFMPSLKTIMLSSFTGTIGVIFLFLWSEDIMRYNNPFQRRYVKNAAEMLKQTDLKFNSFYIAGFTNKRLYLGNYSNPQIMVSFGSNLQNKKIEKIDFDPGNIPFQNVTLSVRGNYIFLKDGRAPALFRGSVGNWKINKKFIGMPYFTRAEPADSTTIIFRNNSGRNLSNVLGIFIAESKPKIKYHNSILEKQIDGIFDTDGALLYSEHLEKMIYLYYYRNEFIVTGKDCKIDYRGHTIDTISKAKIKVTYVKNGSGRTMSAPPLLVNAHGYAFKNLLFVNSRIMGRYEDEKTWKHSSVIDIYDISKHSYLLSFPVYNIKVEKLKSFIVTDTYLYALIGNHLVAYQLKENIRKEIKNSSLKSN
ncbi:DoxX family protein [Flavobacterium notoginsengisoli]|uniref:DoxX family protein n=1 Tax=Flavobacterium notoginsengisoli TaxID=1478199 RepID=UPI00363D9D51